MQVTYNARAFVNDDGQVTITTTIDGVEQPGRSGTRKLSRAFALDILSKQGDEGERAAVEWLKTKGWDVEIEVQAPADKLNLMVGEKPTIKPDLPTLYREAVRWVRALIGVNVRVTELREARSALAACAKADPETAEALIVWADTLHNYSDGALRAVANDLEKCARLAETAVDVASPRKLAQMVWEALGNGGNADEWSLDGARAYLRGRMPSTLAKLHTDLADRVRRYVEAQ